MMIQSSSSQGSASLPSSIPDPDMGYTAQLESNGVSVFNWPTDTNAGTVTVRTLQGALVALYPYPVNQIGPLAEAGDYVATWGGTLRNGQTFLAAGTITVTDLDPAPATPLTAEEKAVETARIDTMQYAVLESAWAQVRSEMTAPYNAEINSTITVLSQLRTGFYADADRTAIQAAYDAYTVWLIDVWQGLFVTTFKGFEQWLIVFRDDHPHANSLRHLF